MQMKKEQLSIEEICKLKWLGVPECAIYIDRSPGAVRNMVLRRAIPYRKPGGRLLFDREQIDEWIKNSEGVSLEELLKSRRADK